MAQDDQPRSRAAPREWLAWTALGGATGLLVLLVVYLARAESPLVPWLVEQHRRWPAFFVLDLLPLGLAWVGWLTGRLLAAHQQIRQLQEQAGPLSSEVLARNLLEAVLVTDATSAVVAANPAARRFFGRNPVGRSIRQLLVDFDRAERVERLAQDGQLLGMEWLFCAQTSGKEVPVRVSCALMPDQRVLYVIATSSHTPAPDPKLASLLRGQERERAQALLMQSLAGWLLANLDRETDEIRELVEDVLCWIRGERDTEDCALGPIFGAVRARVQQEAGVALSFRGETLAVATHGPRLVRILSLLVRQACPRGGGALQVIARIDPDDPKSVRIDVADRTLLPSEPGAPEPPPATPSFSLWVPLSTAQRTLIPTNLVSEEEAPTDPGL